MFFVFLLLLPGRTVCKLLRKIVRLTVCYIWYPFPRLLCALALNIRRRGPIRVIITLHVCILPVCIISGAGPGRSVSIKFFFFFFIIYFIHTIIFIHRISSAYTTTSTGISTRTQNSICIDYINTAALLFIIFVLSHGARNTLCNCRSVARSLRLS